MHANIITDPVQNAMKFCSNPHGVHRKQVTATLRIASQTIIDAGLVWDGDLVCDNCLEKLLRKAKPKDITDTDTYTDITEPSTTPDVLPLENEHGNAISETDPCTDQFSVEDMQVLTDEEASSESGWSSQAESTEDEELEKTTQADLAWSALSKALPELGVSPVKTKGLSQGQKVLKICRKVCIVRESLEASYGTQLLEMIGSGTTERLAFHSLITSLCQSVG